MVYLKPRDCAPLAPGSTFRASPGQNRPLQRPAKHERREEVFQRMNLVRLNPFDKGEQVLDKSYDLLKPVTTKPCSLPPTGRIFSGKEFTACAVITCSLMLPTAAKEYHKPDDY